MLIEAQEKLKKEISNIENEKIIQNLFMYVLGMKAQESINTTQHKATS